ncbi:uncharacterized protein BJ171DRAFT_519644 [Polychytrium aggregatum]|uniref:uncharacterized protein n=1 Tax=Polychytrium aggregatum TaxID=110093 RepID=UPI0022FF441A|nr:uncharacterized protein BJ171DRAFT_519644 [Polychytrium aggregatum]KAI9197470.1 hypothetical protein BJ171DRAFT_519644 [Polychytrium aggregatum]
MLAINIEVAAYAILGCFYLFQQFKNSPQIINVLLIGLVYPLIAWFQALLGIILYEKMPGSNRVPKVCEDEDFRGSRQSFIYTDSGMRSGHRQRAVYSPVQLD